MQIIPTKSIPIKGIGTGRNRFRPRPSNGAMQVFGKASKPALAVAAVLIVRTAL
jgi:hypothetical protein